MSLLLSSRDDKFRVIDQLKELLKLLSFHAMSQSDQDVIAKALYELRSNGRPLNAQMKFYTGNDQRVQVVIDLTNGPGPLAQ